MLGLTKWQRFFQIYVWRIVFEFVVWALVLVSFMVAYGCHCAKLLLKNLLMHDPNSSLNFMRFKMDE
jgi:hypothetical protein